MTGLLDHLLDRMAGREDAVRPRRPEPFEDDPAGDDLLELTQELPPAAVPPVGDMAPDQSAPPVQLRSDPPVSAPPAGQPLARAAPIVPPEPAPAAAPPAAVPGAVVPGEAPPEPGQTLHETVILREADRGPRPAPEQGSQTQGAQPELRRSQVDAAPPEARGALPDPIAPPEPQAAEPPLIRVETRPAPPAPAPQGEAIAAPGPAVGGAPDPGAPAVPGSGPQPQGVSAPAPTPLPGPEQTVAVQIEIGRVEIHAPGASRPPQPPAKTRRSKASPVMSLDRYLASKGGER